ncbi:Peptidase M23 [Tenacibaculum litopenaei]|uniref:M23 family metallopeptidase n=1 Tax=Tenacibaculum litopenaei TaxID=396016 RepID=UPI003892E398
MRFYLIIFFAFISQLSPAQKSYPTDYFDPPLKIPIVLAGTFGELRSNHFHSGIDIKTQGKEGLPIYAAADGYVSRIKVGQYGFGKALYLKHPNGYSTVYAHLQKFAPAIQKHVKKTQYAKKKYAIGNLFPSQDMFPVKKGQLIGYGGDTGSSGGPHLHYEIRESKTDRIINPLLFGLHPKDTIAPLIKFLLAYPMDVASRVNNGASKTALPLKKTGPGTYRTNPITASGEIGFGLAVFDRLNGASNKNGVYSIKMKVNGQTVYYHDVESFTFAESKYINLHIDYPYYKSYKQRVQKTHKVTTNRLKLYKTLVNNGVITISPAQNYSIDIIAKDIENNSSTIHIPVKGVAANAVFTQKDTTAFKIKANEFIRFQDKNVQVAFPKNTFYEDCFIDFSVEEGVAHIHNTTIPLDKRYTLTFETGYLSALQKQQVYIANVNYPKYPRYVSTKKKLDKVYTSTKALGSYTLKFDTKKPTIQPLNFYNKQWISKNKTLKVKIKDRQSGIRSFKASIDGEWILMEYNHKRGILTYDFSDKKLVGSKHIFKIVVADNVGNTKTLKATFFKK